VWPRIPEHVLGRLVPPRFRRFSARFTDPDRLLVEFIDWLESVPPPPGEVPAAGAAGANGRGRDDRARLRDACIDVRERVPSAALAQRLEAVLEDVGVVPVGGDGERFDPQRHRAVGSVPTPDRALHHRIASTERAGYRDGDEVLRPPEVLVYVFEEEGAP
jgi:hypothetical protein